MELNRKAGEEWCGEHILGMGDWRPKATSGEAVQRVKGSSFSTSKVGSEEVSPQGSCNLGAEDTTRMLVPAGVVWGWGRAGIAGGMQDCH